MEVQSQLDLFYIMRLGAGMMVAVAAVVFLISVFGPVKNQATAES
jgi:nitric oxide reductase subunit B